MFNRLEKKYIRAGGTFGYIVSQIHILGECVNFEDFLKKWEILEERYAKKGYRTISLDRFIEHGGWNRPIDEIIGKKRDSGEEAILHAKIYREKYLGKLKPVINIEKMLQDGQPQYWSE